MENHETLEEATMCLFFNVKHKEENDFWLCNALETKVIVYTSRVELFHTVRNKWEKCEQIGEAIFDIPFMIQSQAESMKKILGAL